MPNSGPTAEAAIWQINCPSMIYIIYQVVVMLWLIIMERTPQFPQRLGNGHFAGSYAIYQTFPQYISIPSRSSIEGIVRPTVLCVLYIA